MRIGISGKGGIGKTTISAVLSRTLARRGHQVIAIDCDSDPNLAANIGLGEDGAAPAAPVPRPIRTVSPAGQWEVSDRAAR